MSQTGAPRVQVPRRRARTLWEAGRLPGRQVATLSTLGTLAAAALDVALSSELSLFFGISFTVMCVAASLAVRPRDFYTVAVLPPLLMFAAVTLTGLAERTAIGDRSDSLVQAVISGLAHHAGGLAAGYALALATLALRQVARRNSGRLRRFA